jgi:predicted nucleic acid-binding protein
MHSELADVPALPEPVCEDPDDKFLARALHSEAPVVVSGDKHLLSVSGWRHVEVLSAGAFVDRFLSAGSGSRD